MLTPPGASATAPAAPAATAPPPGEPPGDSPVAAPGPAASTSAAPEGSQGLSAARIAIVDDEPVNVKVVRKYLQNVGYREFVTTNDSREAMALIRREGPDVVLLDVMMPHVDGIQILREIRADAQLQHVPVLILTASTDSTTKQRALESGATDFLSKPVDPSDLVPRIRNALIVKAHHDHLARYSSHLEQQVRVRTAELEASRLHVIRCLARAAEYRDDTTGRHVLRVGRYAAILAREVGFSPSDAEFLGLAAQLHDVGKIGLPDSVLLKPGALSPEEFEVVKRHCEIGDQIISPPPGDAWHAPQGPCGPAGDPDGAACGEFASPGDHPLLRLAARIAMTHHEKWDGSGYPRKLAGEAIPIEGRLVAVADVFDALSSARSYKPAFPPERCKEILLEGRGKHFDPAVLDAFVRRFDDILQVYAEQKDTSAQRPPQATSPGSAGAVAQAATGPQAAQAAPAVAAPAPAPPAAGWRIGTPQGPTSAPALPSTGTVLIVEDDASLRDVLVSIFRRHRVDVLIATTVAEGLAKLKESPAFLVLDVNLPDGSGLDVLRRIRAKGLPIKVAVTTGSPDRAIVAELETLRPEKILWKPYGSSDVVGFLKAAG